MAQKDAQLITQYLPTQSLGYLQSSKVYLEQGDVPNAMAALDTALEHVSKKDAHYQEIVRQRNSTLEVASLSNMQNLGQLSAEILSLIFGSLPVRYLIQCLQVCRGWYKYLEECQEVWSDINLDVDAFPGKRSVKNYVAWLKKRNVRKLKISVECGRAKNTQFAYLLWDISREFERVGISGIQEFSRSSRFEQADQSYLHYALLPRTSIYA